MATPCQWPYTPGGSYFLLILRLLSSFLSPKCFRSNNDNQKAIDINEIVADVRVSVFHNGNYLLKPTLQTPNEIAIPISCLKIKQVKNDCCT
jgi:hypothetical protein